MIWCGVTFEWYHSMGKNSKNPYKPWMTVLFLWVISNHAHARVASSETSSVVREEVEQWFMTAWSW